MKKLLLIITLPLLLTSCANYIASLHREIDSTEQKANDTKNTDQFDMYRKRNFSNNNFPDKASPSINRQYQEPSQESPEPTTRKRVTAKDITDNGGDGSLWSGDTSNVNYLFSRNIIKKTGDIILIYVLDDLKKDITLELRREFPDAPIAPAPTVTAGNSPSTAVATAPATAGPTTPAITDENTEKVHDKISSVIVEEINREHLLLRGRKEILYRGKKRMIELEALVPRREISDNSTVESDKFLEIRILIVK